MVVTESGVKRQNICIILSVKPNSASGGVFAHAYSGMQKWKRLGFGSDNHDQHVDLKVPQWLSLRRCLWKMLTLTFVNLNTEMTALHNLVVLSLSLEGLNRTHFKLLGLTTCGYR